MPQRPPSTTRRRLLAGALLAPLGAPAAEGQVLRLISEDFPPVNFEENGRPDGLAAQLVAEIQHRLGRHEPVEFMPWSRGYRLAQGPGPVCLFTMARTAEREPLFKWVGPVVTFYNALYAIKGPGRRYRTLEEAQRARAILVVRDWFSARELAKRGFRNLVEVGDPARALRMLLARRAPLMAADSVLMPKLVRDARLPEDAVESVFSYAGADGYLAFSLATPDTEVAQWQTALDALKADGSFLRVFKRWLPDMLPPG